MGRRPEKRPQAAAGSELLEVIAPACVAAVVEPAGSWLASLLTKPQCYWVQLTGQKRFPTVCSTPGQVVAECEWVVLGGTCRKDTLKGDSSSRWSTLPSSFPFFLPGTRT